MWSELLSVGFVFLLLGLLVLVSRRQPWKQLGLPGRSQAQLVRSLGMQRLSAAHSVHLIEVDGRRFLAATSPQGCQLTPLSAGGTSEVLPC